MSHPHDSGAHPRSENDRINSRAVLLIGFGSLAVFALAAAAATGYLRHSNQVTPQAALPPEVGQSKIGLVEQQLFGGTLRGARDTAARRAHLEAYGWVDRPAGRLHIPITRAMELVAQGVRVPAGEAPPPPPIGAANGGVDAPGATPPPAAGPVAAPRPTGRKRP
jgi:hypothetical protein